MSFQMKLKIKTDESLYTTKLAFRSFSFQYTNVRRQTRPPLCLPLVVYRTFKKHLWLRYYVYQTLIKLNSASTLVLYSRETELKSKQRKIRYIFIYNRAP